MPLRPDNAEYPPFTSEPMLPHQRRRILLRDCDVVLDVGANEGQYGRWLRSFGYNGRIISFEPMTDVFERLLAATADDPNWECHNLALGATAFEADVQVAENSIGSSLYPPSNQHLRLVPDAKTIRREPARFRPLADLWTELGCDGRDVYLKIDVEGYEREVLAGAVPILSKVRYIELEMSVTEMYKNAPLFHEYLPLLLDLGFHTVALEQNHGDDPDTGQMMMVDGIFRR